MKIHIMGVKGSGAQAVFHLAEKNGYDVTGCDAKDGGHDVSHLKGVDLLVVSPAVLYQKNPHAELLEAKEKNIVITWEEFASKYLMKDKFVIAVAGTHGKSTTTSLIGKILVDAGFDPTVLVGASVPEWGGNARYGNSKYFVVEADEFNDNFLHYNPDVIVLNNIEFDHPDYFKDEQQLRLSFDKFIKNLKPGGKLFDKHLGRKFNLKVMGEHNQDNADMAYQVSQYLGIDEEKIVKSIEEFNGIGRRMEMIGKVNDVKIYSDYAHHPTAIKTTLKGIRENFKNEKIIVIIEPHGYKRTKALLPLYKNIFDSVDSVIVGPIYKARDEVDESISSSDIVKISNHKDIKFVNEFNPDAVNFKDYDIAVFMGAGDSDMWARQLLNNNSGVNFRQLTTIKTGGAIKHFFEINNDNEVEGYVDFAKKNNLPIFIIGEGSDILVSDKDFDGVVLKYVGSGIEYDNDLVTAKAGVVWDKLVLDTLNNGLYGLENLSGIPGLVGAAPIQNIGAYGVELKDFFVSLKAYNIDNQKFVTFDVNECKFGYRDSIFKVESHWQKYLICEIKLKLSKVQNVNTNYESLAKYLKAKNPDKPTAMEVREAVLSARSQKLEDWKVMPNAGSFFKNPIIDTKNKIELENKFPGIKTFPFGEKFKISAGYLIESVGLKGYSLGPVKVSEKHALIITNPEGKGTYEDIYKLAKKIQDEVYAKYKIQLIPEVQYINI